MHLHAWQEPSIDREFRDALEHAFRRYHLERGVISGPATAARAAVALDPAVLIGGAADGAGSLLPPVPELRADFQAGRLAVLGEIDAAWDGEPLTTARLKAYWTLADSIGMPVALFTGVAPPGTQKAFPHYRVELGRPGQIEPILAAYPRLRVNLMQAGWPYREETIALMHEHQEVYADLGNLIGNPTIPREEFYHYLRALIRAGLGDRIMFGSGLTLEEWPAQIGKLVAVIQEAPFLTAEERDKIFFHNAARFLRLDPATRTPRRPRPRRLSHVPEVRLQRARRVDVSLLDALRLPHAHE
ncbi:MAG: amidohydrolase family protein [Betaproteobacteria bacterium]